MKILLSIKPEYTEKIFSGEKKFEFRKQKPKENFNTVFVYESSPSKSIIGYFSVKKIISGSPEKIWKTCKDKGGIKKESYFAYCEDKDVIHAIEIDKIFEFDSPINPFEIHSNFKPPQNFSYLKKSILCDSLQSKIQI